VPAFSGTKRSVREVRRAGSAVKDAVARFSRGLSECHASTPLIGTIAVPHREPASVPADLRLADGPSVNSSGTDHGRSTVERRMVVISSQA
jgi:hypothetical protein